jgi:hypothetical protein
MATEKLHLHAVIDQDGAAILDIERGLISTLNPTGGYVWERLQRGESLDAIIGDLARETGEEYLRVESDVRKFVEDLKTNHLLPQ